ncbi:zinc dependent phospholipase C family protein [Flammeovirga kamogawensis]|uniref:S1/P1 Nuclease n=1 Tax=Flammeovirga kamogawensis TaxID=373891 RepID=A0ABX8H096_9BACT|nr:zinc dependent phospholipase C family protein [Flammeovirga kamogawensis]MBB6459465.1 hypothetical protein [Flammeovirga kamogawensis]QWG09017.1 S1/P1 Nuclease [Flammeovirga kamogawensis]TRX67305.1 S1/P1 Nuclease [Flammeovirga kamogawensis]
MLNFVYLFSFWGFFAHQKINEEAIYLLPNEIFILFKDHIDKIKQGGIRPDQRRRLIKNEGVRHYIDVEMYGNQLLENAIDYDEALLTFSEDSLLAHGLAPWNLVMYTHLLRKAFEEKDAYRIIKYAGEMGHYIADLHVPLHTTHNYNGQLTNQIGIHAFWESTLPEHYAGYYSFLLDDVMYIDNTLDTTWAIMNESHSLVPIVLAEEKRISKLLPNKGKTVVSRRGASLQYQPTDQYIKLYHQAVGDMVESRMEKSIYRLACLWYSCWIDAGQPDLSTLKYITPKQKKKELKKDIKHREHL